jgi:hypothetical protein
MCGDHEAGHENKKLGELTKLNELTPGMPADAFSALTHLAPKDNGKPAVVGPSTSPYGGPIPTIRSLGFRRGATHAFPPILHAKLALVGELWWHDEDELSYVTDVPGFTHFRLWVSSANFTSSSRRNIEFGFWTEDPALVEGAERFLVKLMASSEALNPDSDHFDPELAEIEFDDEAMAEALGLMEHQVEDDF